MKCRECKGPVPNGGWQWCFECAMRRAGALMSGESLSASTRVDGCARKFTRNDRVLVGGRPGTVRRVKREGEVLRYTVDLDGGGVEHTTEAEALDADEGADRGGGDEGAVPCLPDGPRASRGREDGGEASPSRGREERPAPERSGAEPSPAPEA